MDVRWLDDWEMSLEKCTGSILGLLNLVDLLRHLGRVFQYPCRLYLEKYDLVGLVWGLEMCIF